MEIKKIKNIDRSNLIFLITITSIILKYYLFLVYKTNMNTSIPKFINLPLNIIYFTSLLVLILNIKVKKFDVLLIGIGLIITLLVKNENLLIFTTLGLYCKNNNISIKDIIIYYTIINLILFLTIYILNLIGIIPESKNIHYRNGIARNDFGFGNPNVPFLCLIPIIAGYIYLNFEKYNIKNRILIILLLAYVYLNTYSRTGLLVLIITLIMVELFKILEFEKIKNNKFISIIFSNIFTVMAIISGFVALFLNNDKFNVILSSRPKYWNLYMNHLGIFGSSPINGELPPIDNTYVYLFSVFGILTGIYIIYLATIATRSIIKEENKKLYCVILMFAIYSFGENIILNKALSPVLIILVIYFANHFDSRFEKLILKIRSLINGK